MVTFPILKTGAVAQYPARRTDQFRNQTVRFVGGTDQRYRDSAGPRQRWTIRCSALDEAEISAIENFFVTNQGRFGNFTFVDPWDGTAHEDCSFEGDELQITMAGEMRGTTQFTVVRNS